MTWITKSLKQLKAWHLATATMPMLISASLVMSACSSPPPPEPTADIAATVAAAVAAAQPTQVPVQPTPDVDATIEAGVELARASKEPTVATVEPASDDEVNVEPEVVTAIKSEPVETKTPDQALEPAAPTNTPVPPAATSSPAPPTETSTPVPPTSTSTPVPPTATPVPKPPGYVHGIEHGIALLQTDRQPSETRNGWVDITLVLAATRFGPGITKKSAINIESESDAFCFQNNQLPNDCGIVNWGSDEQFTATIIDIAPFEGAAATSTALLLVKFEIAQNATKASISFGEHTIPVDLEGTTEPITALSDPVPAPTPSPDTVTPAGTTGYFMDDAYGIAIENIRRNTRRSRTTDRIEVGLSVILSEPIGDSFAPTYTVSNPDTGLCFGSNQLECVAIFWGDQDQYVAKLNTNDLSSDSRLAGSPVSVKFNFDIPSRVSHATLSFGEHSIPIDTRGMKGNRPNYEYTSYFDELVPGTVLFESQNKTMIFTGLNHHEERGYITLFFDVINNSEASDFSPKIQFCGTRVSNNASMFDFKPHHKSCRFNSYESSELRQNDAVLGPGQSGVLMMFIPLVIGPPSWKYWAPGNDANDRPNGAVFQLIGVDTETGVTGGAIASYVQFVDRKQDDHKFWAPWSGRGVWKFESSGRIEPKFARAMSPAVSEGMVYVGYFSDGLSALDASTGQEIWRFETDGALYSSPAVSDSMVYVGSYDGNLYALDALSGQEIWRFETDGALYSSPAVSDSMVYVGSYDGNLYALDALSGQEIWRFETGDRLDSSPVVSEGSVYIATGGFNKFAFAVDALSGQEIWRSEIGETNRASTSFLVLSEGAIYVGTGHGDFYALDAGSGREIWGFETGGSFDSFPVVSDGTVYARMNERGHGAKSYLYALDARNGQEIWRFETGHPIGSFPVVSDSVVYIGSFGRGLHALDATTGREIWNFNPAGFGTNSSLVISDSVVFAELGHADLYAVDALSGQEIWRFEDSGSYALWAPVVSDGLVYLGTNDGFVYAVTVPFTQ